MSATRVRLVDDPTGSFSALERPEPVHVVHGTFAGDVRAPGALLLAAGTRVEGDVDARGAVHLGRGASVGGQVRAMGAVVVGARASVARGIRAEGRVLVQTGAVVTGALDAAGDVALAPHARVERLLVGGDLHVRRPVFAPKVRVAGRTFLD